MSVACKNSFSFGNKYLKVANRSTSRLVAQEKVDFYNSSPVYCSQLYGCDEPKILDQRFWTVPLISTLEYRIVVGLFINA